MALHRANASMDHESPALAETGRQLILLSWQVIRLPILATLVTLEPLVTLILNGVALLGILMSLFFEYVVQLPNYPFWLMMGISIGSVLCLMGYYFLIRLFSR